MTEQASIKQAKSPWIRVKEFFSFRSAATSGSLVRPGDPFSSWKTLFAGWGIGKTVVSEATAQGIPAFHRAIEVVANQIGSLPVSIFKKDKDGNIYEAKDHPLYDPVKFRPHPLYNSFDFRAAIIRQLMLRGDCYVLPVYRSGKVVRFDFMHEKPDIVELQGNFYYKFPGGKQPKPLVADDVLHFKMHSVDGICGQSPLDLFKDTLERALAEIQLGNKYFTNGGQVSGLLTPSTPLDAKQATQALDFWSKTNTGVDKVGKVGMLPHGFNYLKLGDNMNDSRLPESRRLTTEDISNITGVHPILLANLDRATFTNVEELNRILVQFTLRSFGKVIEDEFNTKMFSRKERGQYFLRLNWDGLLRGDTKARADLYAKLFNIRAINPNEIRKHEGMNPYPGGDSFDLSMASNAKPETQSQTQSDE